MKDNFDLNQLTKLKLVIERQAWLEEANAKEPYIYNNIIFYVR
jgi:hypothetical protein